MTKYDISTGEVSSSLTATSKAAGGFSDDLKPLTSHVSSAITACGNSGAIVPALNGLFQHEETRLKNMGTHIKACLTGAAAATTAYVDGDLEMMKTYQTNAANGKISKIPK
ncbi:MAG: hypothetical protein J2P23_15335 [Microlunatus sp.]|nr:hypothetical protein [Microlunatus sp.]